MFIITTALRHTHNGN